MLSVPELLEGALRKEAIMRTSLIAVLLIAAIALPAQARVHPVRGAVHGTATAARGVGHGAVQAGRGIGHGVVCVVTLGTRCRG